MLFLSLLKTDLREKQSDPFCIQNIRSFQKEASLPNITLGVNLRATLTPKLLLQLEVKINILLQ